ASICDGVPRDLLHFPTRRSSDLNGLHVTQMMGKREIDQSYRFITHNAARTLHLGAEDYGFGVGRPASFIILDAPTWYEALSFNRSEEHTSELQSRVDLVCRLLLE